MIFKEGYFVLKLDVIFGIVRFMISCYLEVQICVWDIYYDINGSDDSFNLYHFKMEMALEGLLVFLFSWS